MQKGGSQSARGTRSAHCKIGACGTRSRIVFLPPWQERQRERKRETRFLSTPYILIFHPPRAIAPLSIVLRLCTLLPRSTRLNPRLPICFDCLPPVCCSPLSRIRQLSSRNNPHPLALFGFLGLPLYNVKGAMNKQHEEESEKQPRRRIFHCRRHICRVPIANDCPRLRLCATVVTETSERARRMVNGDAG